MWSLSKLIEGLILGGRIIFIYFLYFPVNIFISTLFAQFVNKIIKFIFKCQAFLNKNLE